MQKESEQERINREAAERLGLTRTPTFGSEKERGGGVFQVQRVGMDDAEFFFYGWNKAIRRNARQMISVRREGNPTIEIAVVRKMISIIREYAKDDFTWESQRLGRDAERIQMPVTAERVWRALHKREFDAAPLKDLKD